MVSKALTKEYAEHPAHVDIDFAPCVAKVVDGVLRLEWILVALYVFARQLVCDFSHVGRASRVVAVAILGQKSKHRTTIPRAMSTRLA